MAQDRHYVTGAVTDRHGRDINWLLHDGYPRDIEDGEYIHCTTYWVQYPDSDEDPAYIEASCAKHGTLWMQDTHRGTRDYARDAEDNCFGHAVTQAAKDGRAPRR